MIRKILLGRGWALTVAGLTVAMLQTGLVVPVRAQDNGKLDAEVHKALNDKRLEGISVSVQGNNVVLTGTVPVLAIKEYADNRVHHVHGVKGVDNEIQVEGPRVEDSALQEKLAKELSYYTVGYGTTAFTDLRLGVHNGEVSLSGTVYWPPDKASALSIVANTPGVRDIDDDIKVAPLSPMDDQLRLRLERVIYGDPTLQKYAINPAKPIRINVINGDVTLVGVVDSKMDKDIAGIRANSVPGVFKVVNDLQIAAPQPGK